MIMMMGFLFLLLFFLLITRILLIMRIKGWISSIAKNQQVVTLPLPKLPQSQLRPVDNQY